MARLVFAVLALCLATVSARMAYQLSADAETILRARSITETFSCEGRPYGYYADIDNNCEIFHVCLPVTDSNGDLIETAHFSFVCGNQTIFDQASLTCQHPAEAFPCQESNVLYDLSNSEFGIIPEERN